MKRPIQHCTVDVRLIKESVFGFCLGMSYGYVSVSWLSEPGPGYPVVGRQPSRRGSQHTILVNFSKNLDEIENIRAVWAICSFFYVALQLT